MKILRRVFSLWFLIFGLWFLAGCATTPAKEALKEKEKEEAVLPSRELVEGRAMPGEEILALKGEDIPLVKKEGLRERKKALTKAE